MEADLKVRRELHLTFDEQEISDLRAIALTFKEEFIRKLPDGAVSSSQRDLIDTLLWETQDVRRA
jgi:hypothetical protein